MHLGFCTFKHYYIKHLLLLNCVRLMLKCTGILTLTKLLFKELQGTLLNGMTGKSLD